MKTNRNLKLVILTVVGISTLAIYHLMADWMPGSDPSTRTTPVVTGCPLINACSMDIIPGDDYCTNCIVSCGCTCAWGTKSQVHYVGDSILVTSGVPPLTTTSCVCCNWKRTSTKQVSKVVCYTPPLF